MNNDKNEIFKLFYQNQYDRIDKLETKRENFCNFIITISSALLVLGLNNYTEKNPISNSILIFTFTCLINIIAIMFISKTRPLIKIHQKRADLTLKILEPKLLKIKSKVKKPDSNGDLFRRSLLYTYVHSIIILISIVVIIKNTKWICECFF